MQYFDSVREEDRDECRDGGFGKGPWKKKIQGSFTLFGEKMLSPGADLPNVSEHSMGMLSL